MTDPKGRDPEATRNAILEAAEEIFLERGYGSAAVSEIAQRAEVTKSLIHHHFGSKRKLWDAVKFRRLSDYAEEQIRMLDSRVPEEGLLRESLEIFFRFLQRQETVVRLFAWMYLDGDPHEDEPPEHLELFSKSIDRMRMGQQAGLLRDDVDARFILAMFMSLTKHWFLEREHLCCHFGGGDSLEELDEGYLRAIQKVFIDGVRQQ